MRRLVGAVALILVLWTIPSVDAAGTPIYTVSLAPRHGSTVSGNVTVAYNIADIGGDTSDISVVIAIAIGKSDNWTTVVNDTSNVGMATFDSRPFTNATVTLRISAKRERDGQSVTSFAIVGAVHIGPFDPQAPTLEIEQEIRYRHILVKVTPSDPDAFSSVTLFRNFCTNGPEGFVCQLPQAPVAMDHADANTFVLDVRKPDYAITAYLQAHGTTNGSTEVVSPFVVMHTKPIGPPTESSLWEVVSIAAGLAIVGVVVGIVATRSRRQR